MSVWSTPCFRIEPLIKTLQNYALAADKLSTDNFASECDFMVDDSDALLCDTESRIKAGTLHDTVPRKFIDIATDNPSVMYQIRTYAKATRRSNGDELFCSIRELRKPKYVGLKAVYWTANLLRQYANEIPHEFEYEEFRAYWKSVYVMSAPTSRLNIGRYARIAAQLDSTFGREWFEQRNLIEAIRHLWIAGSNRDYKRATGRWLRNWKSQKSEKTKPTKAYFAKVRIKELRDIIERALEERKGKKNKQDENFFKPLKVSEKKLRAYESELEGLTNVWGESTKINQKDKKDAMLSDSDVPYIPFFKNSKNMSKYIQITKFSNGYYVTDIKTGETATLFWKEHLRLLNYLTGILKCEEYFSAYDIHSPSLTQKMYNYYKGIKDDLMEQASNLSGHDAGYLARALDVKQFMYYARLASDVSKRSMKEQQDKWDKEGLQKIYNPILIDRMLADESLGIAEKVELLKIYKILPCPDFDHFSAIPDIARKFDKPNNWKPDNTVKVDGQEVFKTSLDEFQKYQKRSMINMYLAKNKHLPGKLVKDAELDPKFPLRLAKYPNVDPTLLTVSDMDWIDIKGSFTFKPYDNLEYELVKDKTTAPPDGNDDRMNVKTNQLCRYLFDPEFEDMDVLRTAINEGREKWQKHIKIAWKAESKKPSSRIFYMATDQDRRPLSELESNCAEYVKHKLGSSQGKSTMDLNESMSKIGVYRKYPNLGLIISFDLKAFSPSQCREFKELGLQKWGDAFNLDHVKKLDRIFNNRKIYVDKFGHMDGFNQFGGDLEGFNARLNTDMHIDIMGYAIYKLRQSGKTSEPALFECLIDDGLLNVQVPIGKDETTLQKNADDIMDCIEQVYNAFGLSISWDKTFYSHSFYQYLNEIYWEGRRISPGLKAYIRIGQPTELPIDNMMDELMTHAATASGALKSNAPHPLVYASYIVEYYLSIKRWSGYKKLDNVMESLQIRAFVPFQLGGFGMVSMTHLATNETFNSLAAGVSNLRMIAYAFPEVGKSIAKIMNMEPDEMSAEGMLRNPKSLKFTMTALNNKKFPNSVRGVVLEKSVAPYILNVKARLIEETGSVLAGIIAVNKQIHDVIREKLWEMDPMHAIESLIGKMQNSSTAATLLGFRKVLALRLVYRLQARAVIFEVNR